MVAHQGRIYVGGGFGQDKAILCSVESYDPDTDKVSQPAELQNYCLESLPYFRGEGEDFGEGKGISRPVSLG